MSARQKAAYRPGPFSHPTFGEYHLYTWCARCQRVDHTWKWNDGEWRCPSLECQGESDEAWRWEEVRRVNGEFPSHPLLGRTYKLYSFDWEIAEQEACESVSSSQEHALR